MPRGVGPIQEQPAGKQLEFVYCMKQISPRGLDAAPHEERASPGRSCRVTPRRTEGQEGGSWHCLCRRLHKGSQGASPSPSHGLRGREGVASSMMLGPGRSPARDTGHPGGCGPSWRGRTRRPPGQRAAAAMALPDGAERDGRHRRVLGLAALPPQPPCSLASHREPAQADLVSASFPS